MLTYLTIAQKISGEHYFSKSILQEISQFFTVQGIFESPKSIPIKGLVVNCLCTKHNSSLSDFDSEALHLFKTIKRYDFETHPKNVKNFKSEIIEIDGKKFEKWFLKTIYNFNEGGLFKINNTKVKFSIPPYYLGVLFYNQEFPENCGLSIVFRPQINLGDTIYLDVSSLSLNVRFANNGELCAVEVLFHGILFVLTLNGSVHFVANEWNHIKNTFHCPGFILQDSQKKIRKEVKFNY